MNVEKGQSLIELLVAVAVFVITASGMIFFILDSYAAGILSGQLTQANFLAKEGVEAATSIRNSNWDDLTAGSHGLSVSEGNWTFQGEEEDVSFLLNQGTRKVIVNDVSPDRKEIVSRVSWSFGLSKPQELELVTYLTNWQKIAEPPSSQCQGTPIPCEDFDRENDCLRQDGCSWQPGSCQGACTFCSALRRGACQRQDGCNWFWLVCWGDCVSCDNYLIENDCLRQDGCSWDPEFCQGLAVSCDAYSNKQDCQSQDGCQWIQ